ncbi:Receptor-type tyrosine-protein phosphatase C [Cyphomyrmex costatus]|uniref:protein-tyrosine-phosphatase n=1 Tax=Cyphomyrmex costatus TaxID=456900 RepID=A0A151INF5_9HYME|nr:Receptor-type tyrosine-protein phosphatase C [Cyphomyrmex costatus]
MNINTKVIKLNFAISGTLLLFFDNTVAEVTEASIASENSESQKTSTPQGSTTILTKVFSIHHNQSFTENDGKNIESTNRKAHDTENRSYDSIDSVNQDEEKNIHVNSNAEKTNDESENSSSDGSRKPRYGEIAVESTGKSTSTKVVSDDLLRLSRKNELTAATAKSAFDDSKQDSKNLENVSLQESLNHEKISDATKTISPNAKETIVNEKLVETSESKEEVDTKKDKNTISTDLKEEVEDYDRELTTVRGEKSLEYKKSVNDLRTTASEVFDLEKTDEKEHEESVSLVNDTYVNFNNFYKTVTERDLKTSSRNHSVDANESRKKDDPKKEVEIVKDVTDPLVLRIVTANDTAKNDTHINELSNQERAYDKKKGETSAKDENTPEQSVDFSITTSNTTTKRTDRIEEWKSIGEPESQVKLPETTQSVRLEERTSSVPETTPSLVPQGRTIGFSGANKFPNNEVKTTASMRTDGEILVTQSLQNSTEKVNSKPYPYLKSSRGPFQRPVTEASLKLKKEDDVTEESSAYENTIGRGESEKKLVVTEPSVVIENSIQQHNSNKKNESTNSTTKSLSSLKPVTAIPSVSAKVEPMNETFPEGFNGSTKATEIKHSKSNESDTSGTREEEKVIVGRDEGYDVTGNGITEISLTPDGQQVKSRFSGTTESATLRSTETHTSKTVSLSTDVQMEPEEAMMIRSTFVVTESTSVVPLNEDATTEANRSKTLMTAVEVNTIATVLSENSTKSASNVTLRPSLSVNHTTESPSFITLNPDESPIPTTTSVEFEFVTLTEPISPGNNATEKSVEGQTFEEQTIPSRTTTIQNSSAMDNSTENAITAMKPEEFTELPVTTEDGTPTTDQMSDMHHNGTTRGPTVIQITTESQNNLTERNEVTVSGIDFTSAAPGNVTRASGVTEDPSKSKDSSFDANITETSAPGATELPPNTSVRITMNVTKRPSVTSTLEPIIFWSTMSYTESPEEEITENIPTPSPDEVTLLVKIIIEGTLHEVCPRLSDLRKALADVLRDGLNKPVQPQQIMIHQNPCQEQNALPTPTDVSLISILIYVIDENGKFDAAMTKILPSLYKVSPNFPVRVNHSFFFIMRKRQTRFNYGERCRPVSLDAYSLDSVSAYNSVRRKGAVRSSKRSYGNPTFEDSSAIPSHPLNFAGLSSFCNDVNAINEEFAGVPQVSAKIDELPPGAEVKNRYANVIPLPETRVPLQRLNNDALTEYINASYVRGPKNATKYYIACQAPIESTVIDFWRMIWEQQSKVIIMLTDLVENEVEKCTEYIPPSEITDCHRLYGDFQVTLKKRETKEKYAISTLHLKNLENNTFREVFHIWYLWPVSGVQSDGTGLIAVLLEARALQRGGPGPIVVHCSPGTGRTGTLIALDLGIRQYEITRTVDVPRVVYTIRRDRAGAVQTKEQYAFIYKVIIDSINRYTRTLKQECLSSSKLI